MKQRDILKYALVGALELYQDAQDNEQPERAAACSKDYEAIRDMLFEEIEKATGRTFE